MSDSAPEPAQVYLQLRSRILSLKPGDVKIAPSIEAPHIWCLIMETGYNVGTATLVCMADGTTSLYYSTGGGMLGSGEYVPVAEASKTLLAQAEIHLPHMSPTTQYPLPETGEVRFIALTYAGNFADAAPEKLVARRSHPLSPLFTSAQNVLAQLRLLAEQK